jgi:glycosyltransferase involved in cell wall biosynthesis
MSLTPRLTIGLPVYNGENFLAESIEALLGQTFEDFELIISDNASTDSTSDICSGYAKLDSRIRYIRQEVNIGLVPNHNFIAEQGTSEFFKMAAHDDLYGRDLLKRCVDALDEHPDVVLAHSWEARIDTDGRVFRALRYPVAADAPRAPDRFRSMLFDGWDDYTYGVIRTPVLRRTRGHGTYHFADRTRNTELNLHGPFYLVPEWLYFRREHPGRTSEHPDRSDPYTVRTRSTGLDPRRATRLRSPMVRLYFEYIWSYVLAIRDAPLSDAERRECYRHLVRWVIWRLPDVARRALHSGTLHDAISTLEELPDIDMETVVPRRDWDVKGAR